MKNNRENKKHLSSPFRATPVFTVALLCLNATLFCQHVERIVFDSAQLADNYYLAIRPASNNIKGTIVLLTSFLPPDGLLAETKLHNTASANDLLTVVAPMNQQLYADSVAVGRINRILSHVAAQFTADTAKFILGGYDEAGSIALRYTERCYERPADHPLQPKAVFTVDSPVDIFNWWHWSENQVKKNYWQGAVGDAKFYLETMTREHGTIYENPKTYELLTPFHAERDTPGNEQYLQQLPVRLYYDLDINWQLQNRRNSFYDTKIPAASELIKRLLLSGNDKAELVASKQPGRRSNGDRNPNALSIVDEIDLVQWAKQALHIFDPAHWQPPYVLASPAGWNTERFQLPPEFATKIPFKGVEEVRFAPGWGEISSEEHWSYAFLWWLEGKHTLNAEVLQATLQQYYSGLVGRNITSRNIPSARQVPTVITLNAVKKTAKDLQTFSGTINMLDYHAQAPITLNCRIHVKDIGEQHNTAIFIELSPKPFTNIIWQALDRIGESFKLKNL